jgi:hypothetical protein
LLSQPVGANPPRLQPAVVERKLPTAALFLCCRSPWEPTPHACDPQPWLVPRLRCSVRGHRYMGTHCLPRLPRLYLLAVLGPVPQAPPLVLGLLLAVLGPVPQALPLVVVVSCWLCWGRSRKHCRWFWSPAGCAGAGPASTAAGSGLLLAAQWGLSRMRCHWCVCGCWCWC